MLGSCGQPWITELGRLTPSLQFRYQVIQPPPHLHMLLLDSSGVYRDICRQNAKGFKILSVALEESVSLGRQLSMAQMFPRAICCIHQSRL